MINFKNLSGNMDGALTDLVERKLHSLEHYIGDAPALCDVEFEKVAPKQNGDVFRVEVNLTINGTLYRADATMDSYEKAVDEVRDELDKELRRSQQKHDSMVKKGGRQIKEMMRFSA